MLPWELEQEEGSRLVGGFLNPELGNSENFRIFLLKKKDDLVVTGLDLKSRQLHDTG